MKKLISILMIITMVLGSIPVYADQVWGDAVEVTGSNHDQIIELNVTQGETWSTPLNVSIVQSGKQVTFPVSGSINASNELNLTKTNWNVTDYSQADSVQVSKTETILGSFSYDVIFIANTDLDALSKSFDKVIIKVNVNASNDPIEDTTAPIIQAPSDIIVEATNILTPVELGEPVVDDPEALISNNSPGSFPIGSTTIQWQAIDPSGNIGLDEQMVTITDTTPPVFTSIPSDIKVIYAGSQTYVDLGSAQATDIFPVIITNNYPQGGFPLGTSIVEWKAEDSNGNIATVYQTVSVQYDFKGFLQPINTDGSSIFKLGSTVPVKFKLADAFGNSVTNATGNVYVTKVTDSVLGSISEAISTSSATTGNLIRYDSTAAQYIFNLSTKPLTKGTYSILVRLNDGTEYSVKISLR